MELGWGNTGRDKGGETDRNILYKISYLKCKGKTSELLAGGVRCSCLPGQTPPRPELSLWPSPNPGLSPPHGQTPTQA